MSSPSAKDALLRWLARWLAHPRLTHAAFIGAVLLTLPSLFGPLTLDDYVLGLLSQGGDGVAGFAGRDPNALFTFTTGRQSDNLALMSEGVLLPWWTDPAHLNAFFRPLSSLTHRLDFALFPHSSMGMHLHSLVWYLLLIAAAMALYRSLHEGQAWLAAVALLLFAWDDPHGATLGWIANRNAIIAGALGLPAVLLHRRWVLSHSGRLGPLAAAGPLCLAVALCAGEAALGVLGYLLAHALCLEGGALWRRALRLTPYALVLVAWRIPYALLSLGSGGSGAYHDPTREPVAFALALARNLPILLGAQFGPPYADAAFWAPPEHQPAQLLLSACILLVVVALSVPVLRTRPLARFYALGCLLSAIPVSASLPGERLLLLLGLGGSGLVALLIDHYMAQAHTSNGAAAALSLVVGLHLVAAPVALPFLSGSMPLVGAVVERAERSLPEDPSVTGQTFVIVNAPFDVAASYIQAARAFEGRPRPRHLHWLATASSPIRVRADSEHSLLVDIEGGLLKSPQARHYRGDLSSLSSPARVTLPAMTVQILAADPHTGPTRMRFDFGKRLDSADLRFFLWRGGTFVPFTPRADGPERTLPREDFFQVVLGHALGP